VCLKIWGVLWIIIIPIFNWPFRGTSPNGTKPFWLNSRAPAGSPKPRGHHVSRQISYCGWLRNPAVDRWFLPILLGAFYHPFAVVRNHRAIGVVHWCRLTHTFSQFLWARHCHSCTYGELSRRKSGSELGTCHGDILFCKAIIKLGQPTRGVPWLMVNNGQ